MKFFNDSNNSTVSSDRDDDNLGITDIIEICIGTASLLALVAILACLIIQHRDDIFRNRGQQTERPERNESDETTPILGQ